MLGKIFIYTVIATLTIFVINPSYFTYVYFLTRPLMQPFAIEKMMVFGVPLTGIVSLQLVGFTIFWGVVRKDFSFRVPNIIPLCFLLIIALFSVVNTLDSYASLLGFAKLLTAVMSYVLVYNIVKTEDEAKSLLWLIVIATLVPMVIGYYQYFTESGGKAIDDDMNRVRSTLGFANAYGIYLVLSLIAAIMLLLHPRWRVNKYLLAVIVLSMLVSSIVALNRGTWIAFSIAVVVATLFYIRRIRIRWIVLAVVTISALFSTVIVNRFQQLEDRGYHNMNTFERRVAYWESTIEMIPEHPIIGWGIGTAQQVMQTRFTTADKTHNDYLRLQLEVGILGVGAYLLFLFREALRAFFNKRTRRLLYVSYPLQINILYFVIISFVQNIYDHMVNLPLFLALIAVSYRLIDLSRETSFDQGAAESNQSKQSRNTVRKNN